MDLGKHLVTVGHETVPLTMFRRLLLMLRRRIAVKLTLTLLGFVAVMVVVAGVYLTQSLQERAI